MITQEIDKNGVARQYHDWPPPLADGYYWGKQHKPMYGLEIQVKDWTLIRVISYIHEHPESYSTSHIIFHSWDIVCCNGETNDWIFRELLETSTGTFVRVYPPEQEGKL